ncbi:MAG: ABC transporter substrate-binding protein [Acidimicrobiales bacterium]
MALAEAPDALDPTTAQTYVGRIVLINICQKLYDINAKTQLIPELASQMPQISNGGKTYTIKLRSGIKFNDGTAFNAQAVKTTLERDIKDPKSSRASSLTAIQSVTVVDPTTIKLTLSKPYAPLTSILAGRAGMIESPAQLKKLGDKFGTHPVCVGPFEFVSRPSSDQINIQKSPDYYAKSSVHLAKVKFEVVTQPTVRATDLKAGSIQVVDRVQPSDVASLKGDSSVKLDPVTTLGYQGITINVSNSKGASKVGTTVSTPLAQHQSLRKAFDLAINRDALNKVVFDGQYLPGCSPISPVSPYFAHIPCPKQNISEAKKLVAASGVKTPIPITLIVQASNAEAIKLGSVLQNMVKPAGFALKISPTEFTTALSQSKAGKFDTFQVGWSGRVDPDQNIGPFWGPKSLLNYSGANYPKLDQLIAKARTTTDKSTRKQLYGQIVKELHQKLNIIYLYYPKDILGLRSNLTGVKYYADALIRLYGASLTSGG